ncbi:MULTISPECIES: hypothetical protein [unclassified Burkholderia]|uniref:hypothetical protein n=1 Tax=unclassified Burkholderia TaxID=2613784 RepID=UPI001420CBAD|nr:MULTISPECIES: hypothetical protein [unclassified Burkholderia]NIE57682.1 hypothetical protein [Burkholderia sp. Ap-955]NIF10018.1 hypothetical protein [Burkholderia sp. Ax-1735]NIG03352.1 hypothetical protein [Burkholderia sp. Tr-849]
MIVHTHAVSDLAAKIIDTPYVHLRHCNASHVTLVHGAPQAVAGSAIRTTSLLAFDLISGDSSRSRAISCQSPRARD